MPLLREYLEYEIDCVIRYWRIHIQWGHEGLNQRLQQRLTALWM